MEINKSTETKPTVSTTVETVNSSESTENKKITSQREPTRPSYNHPQFPKLSTYDGTSDWKAYQLQFTHTATRFKWDDQQKIDNLLLCLRGKALKFFSTRQSSVQNNFTQMMEQLSRRFGNKELPNSIRRQLQDVKQTMEETIEEFAERVQ